MISSDIHNIIIEYLDPYTLRTFFLLHKINPTIKFKYNAFFHAMTHSVFNNTFESFPNIVFIGINIICTHICPKIDIINPQTITKIRFLGNYFCELPDLTKYTNLTHLHLEGFLFSKYKSIHAASMLRHLNLSRCYSCVDDTYNFIIKQPNLRSYHLPFGAIINGSYLTKLKKLHTITITEGSRIQQLSFLHMCKALKRIIFNTYNDYSLPDLSNCLNVYHLVLQNCYHLHTLDFHRILPPHLRHIEIISCDLLHSIINLPTNLISIKIIKCQKLCNVNTTTGHIEIINCPLLLL